MTQIDPQLLADFQAFQAFQAMNAQESGVIVEATEPKKSPAKRTTTAKKSPAKKRTTAKKSPAKSPAKPPVGCLTMGDVWTILGADPEFEPNAEKFDVPAYGNWLARANHLGLLAPAQ